MDSLKGPKYFYACNKANLSHSFSAANDTLTKPRDARCLLVPMNRLQELSYVPSIVQSATPVGICEVLEAIKENVPAEELLSRKKGFQTLQVVKALLLFSSRCIWPLPAFPPPWHLGTQCLSLPDAQVCVNRAFIALVPP
jgi:hypothetical protein